MHDFNTYIFIMSFLHV